MLTNLGEARELKLPLVLDHIKIVSAPAQWTVFDLHTTFNIVATTNSSTMIMPISSRAIYMSIRNLRVKTAVAGKLDALNKRNKRTCGGSIGSPCFPHV